jgi:hypothetical protein
MLGTNNYSRNQKLITGSLIGAALLGSSVGLFRQLWAWPDAIGQTTLSYLPDIDIIMSGNPGGATWFELGNGHATNGYRLLTYFNAVFLGLNSRLDLVVYWLLVLMVSVAFVLVLGNKDKWRAPSALSALLIIAIMTNLSGAGAAGMEIGTYIGQAAMLAALLLSVSRISVRAYFLCTSILVPILLFFFLGGYLAGWAAGLLSVAALSYLRLKKQLISESIVKKIIILAVQASVWSGLFYLIIPKTNYRTSLFDVWGSDIMFPIKFIIFGFSTPIFTSQSFESLPLETGSLYYFYAGLIVFLFVLISFGLSLRSSGPEILVGQSLVLFGIGTSLMLLFTRAFGEQTLLSSWYSFNFKLALCGAVILASSTLANRKLITVLASYTIVAVLIGVSYNQAMIRQPHERAYWLNLQKATYYPETLKDRGDGFTQLIASLEQSRISVEILRKHKLGVYRPGAVNIEDFRDP